VSLGGGTDQLEKKEIYFHCRYSNPGPSSS